MAGRLGCAFVDVQRAAHRLENVDPSPAFDAAASVLSAATVVTPWRQRSSPIGPPGHPVPPPPGSVERSPWFSACEVIRGLRSSQRWPGVALLPGGGFHVVERADRRVGAEVVGQRYTEWGYPRIVAVLTGVFLVLFGVWALAAPEPFFESVATFEPYNQHFVQDLGAFQIGLGAVLVLAATFRDALVVGLLGVGLGSAAHVVSHAVGHDLGGEPAVDIPVFSIVTVLLVSAGMVRLSRGR